MILNILPVCYLKSQIQKFKMLNFIKQNIQKSKVRRCLAQVIMGEKSTFGVPINSEMNCILQFW